MARKRGEERQARGSLPEPVAQDVEPYRLDALGWWLILADIHLPYHDKKTIECAVAEARRRHARGVILNGDVMDNHEISRFDKSPDDPSYPEEVRMARQFLAWLRQKLPKATIVWKDGNHDERLLSYLFTRAPALFGLDVLEAPHLLQFDRHKIDYVHDRRVIRLGKLSVIHGHEYRPTMTTPVNVARGLFLRAKSSALCSHHHQTSEHHESDITGTLQSTWSTGCACQLRPFYMPLNRWNHGYAMVQVGAQGQVEVDNIRLG